MKTLETDRLIIRSWEIQDIDDLFEYAQNPNVGLSAGWKPHENKEETMNILLSFISGKEVWAIEHKDHRKVIGSIGIHEDQKRKYDQSKMLGYVLSEAYWGHGLMTEAAKRVIQYAFETTQINVLSVYHYPGNIKSKRVIEKCGFVYEGVLRQASVLFNGQILDDICYSILRSEYINT